MAAGTVYPVELLQFDTAFDARNGQFTEGAFATAAVEPWTSPIHRPRADPSSGGLAPHTIVRRERLAAAPLRLAAISGR